MPRLEIVNVPLLYSSGWSCLELFCCCGFVVCDALFVVLVVVLVVGWLWVGV
jgi:hypothetical protein